MQEATLAEPNHALQPQNVASDGTVGTEALDIMADTPIEGTLQTLVDEKLVKDADLVECVCVHVCVCVGKATGCVRLIHPT